MTINNVWSKDRLQNEYNSLSTTYQNASFFVNNVLGVRWLRSALLRKASGQILDVACGTGENFPFFRPGSTVTAVDLSPGMLAQARRRAAGLNLTLNLQVMDAEKLAFPDAHFDTVVSAMSTCTFPDPLAVLREMARVCRPDGRILLIEHGRSSLSPLANHQDRTAHRYYERAGCRWNQDPFQLVREAGLSMISARRARLGIMYIIEARPH